MPVAISKDGTSIVYEKNGAGPVVILINGALAHRNFYGEKALSDSLADRFTVIYYDRRGRGESGDTKPYKAEKEIEDIEALIADNGGKAHLYGSSSGAALALLATAKIGPGKIGKAALYEPPYSTDNAKDSFAEEKKKINELVANGKTGDAAAFFLENRGTPAEVLEEMKKSSEWEEMERVAHSLVYDFEVLGNGKIPIAALNTVAVPIQILDGEKSFDFIHATADTLAEMIPGAVRKTLKGQTHQAAPEILAPELKKFLL